MRATSTEVVPTGRLPMPEPSTSWPAEVVDAWRELWATPLAAQYVRSDVPALRRLFTYRARLVDAMEHCDAEPESTGSTGQRVLSPWFAELHRLEAEVARLEERFGLTPLSRLRLGITVAEGVSLAARNAELLRSFTDGQ